MSRVESKEFRCAQQGLLPQLHRHRDIGLAWLRACARMDEHRNFRVELGVVEWR